MTDADARPLCPYCGARSAGLAGSLMCADCAGVSDAPIRAARAEEPRLYIVADGRAPIRWWLDREAGEEFIRDNAADLPNGRVVERIEGRSAA